MIRPTSLILLALAAAAGGALFHVSFEVSELDARLAELNRDIRGDREAIHVLNAEWSFLNQPERLEELARRHLDLMPVAGSQLAGAGTLPLRPEAQEPETLPEAPLPEAGQAISLELAAPRAKPAVPARLSVAVSAPSVAAEPAPAPAAARSLDDILREVTADAPPPGTAGDR